MKSVFLAITLFGICSAYFTPFDIAESGKILLNGTFCSKTNLSSNVDCLPTIWVADPDNDRYYQDIGFNGGQFIYTSTASYAIRAGFCTEILGYTSTTLRNAYMAAVSFSFNGDGPDNRTFTGMGSSTCRTPLSQAFKANNRGVMRSWIFNQLAPASIPGIGNVCLNVNGQIDFNDEVIRNFDPDPFFILPSACSTPLPGGYCANFYFPPNGQCNYGIY